MIHMASSEKKSRKQFWAGKAVTCYLMPPGTMQKLGESKLMRGWRPWTHGKHTWSEVTEKLGKNDDSILPQSSGTRARNEHRQILIERTWDCQRRTREPKMLPAQDIEPIRWILHSNYTSVHTIANGVLETQNWPCHTCRKPAFFAHSRMTDAAIQMRRRTLRKNHIKRQWKAQRLRSRGDRKWPNA